MKKKIGFVSMDSVLAQWLLEKLIQEPPESECAEDLLSGIYDMLSGEATSLLLRRSPLSRPPMKYESGSWKSIRRAGE